jgi:hypothetical protein
VHYQPVSFIHTADATIEQLRFDGGDMFLQLIDFAEQLRSYNFHDVLAFSWGYLPALDLWSQESSAR